MTKLAQLHEGGAIYDEVSRCVLYFSDGDRKIIVNQQAGSMLAVNVISYPVQDPNFMELVFKHYKPYLSVEELAKKCGYNSVKTFTRHFKKSFHTTPKQWMLSLREDKMLIQLKNTRQPLKQIAADLGFANVAHLSDFCLKRTGQRPEKIREASKSIRVRV